MTLHPGGFGTTPVRREGRANLPAARRRSAGDGFILSFTGLAQACAASARRVKAPDSLRWRGSRRSIPAGSRAGRDAAFATCSKRPLRLATRIQYCTGWLTPCVADDQRRRFRETWRNLAASLRQCCTGCLGVQQNTLERDWISAMSLQRPPWHARATAFFLRREERATPLHPRRTP